MKCQREKFLLQRKYAYLNCAYMSPNMKKVEHAGIKGLQKKRKPFHISAEDFFHETETIRLLFSKLINNCEPKRVVIVPSVSYGIANVVNNLPFNSGKILLLDEQFPSNVYPWLTLQEKGFHVETVKAPKSETKGEDWNANILNAIDEKTKVVAIGHVHWADGTIFNLKAIRKKLDKIGGLLIIDGTQSVGALHFDISEIRPDALICAAYKWLMGPYSIGLAYYSSMFDQGKPIEHNWINRKNSEDFSGLVAYETEFQEMALRYEVGEHSNFVLIPMLHEALKQVLRWGTHNIQSYCKNLMDLPIKCIQEWGYSVENEVYRSNHLFGIKPPSNVDLEQIKKSIKKHKVSVSFRGEAIRISPHVYNDEMDVRKLLKGLKE
ncbi:MAG: aminotransferase class V-fold PLP-dependent enzyme, partial [Bacteroidota bacterium]